MNFVFIAFFCCVYCVSSFCSEIYELSICAIFKNERLWLKEWIEYHRLLGVEHFYLYDNESQDDPLSVLQPYIEQDIVDVIPWSNISEHHDNRENTAHLGYQLKAYNDCIKKTVTKTKWIAMIDLDEFIVPLQEGKKFIKTLLRMAPKDVGSFKLFWTIFGTSHTWELPSNKLMVESLILRAKNEHPWNALYKCIHRTKAVKDCWIHHAWKLKKGYRVQEMSRHSIRINHYWTGDEKSLLGQKRWHVWHGNRPENLQKCIPEYHYNEFLKLDIEFNAVKDTAILQYANELRKSMNID